MATKVIMKETELSCLNETDILVKPELAFKSETNSMLLTRQLFAVSISAICYLRKVYPKEYFRPRRIGNIGYSMQMLQNVKSDPNTTRFLKWVKGCFEAMKKGYLRDIIVGIQPPGEKDIRKALESYTFRIKYSDACLFGGDNLKIPRSHLIKINAATVTPKTLEQNITDCLYNCKELVKNMPELPQGCSLGMMLTYYEGTPDEYEPPGFKPCAFEDYEYPPDLQKIEVGKCSTPYHMVRMGAFAKFISIHVDEEQNESFQIVEDSQSENICNTSEAANMSVLERSENTDLLRLNTMTEDLSIYHDTSLTKMLFSPAENCELQKVRASSCSEIPPLSSKETSHAEFHNRTINIGERDLIKRSIVENHTQSSDNSNIDRVIDKLIPDEITHRENGTTRRSSKRKQVLDPEIFQKMCHGPLTRKRKKSSNGDINS